MGSRPFSVIRLPRNARFLCVSFFLLLLGPAAKQAYADMKDWKTEKFLGVPLSAPIKIELTSGRSLEVPFGYLWGRGGYMKDIQAVYKMNSVTFAFWHSDRAPSIEDSFSFGGFVSPTEQRPKDDYLIYVGIGRWDKDGTEVTPRKKWNNIRKYKFPKFLSRTITYDGIVEYRLTDELTKRVHSYYWYEGPSGEVLIDCSTFSKNGDDAASCPVDAYQSSDNLLISALIPRERVSDWKSTVNSSTTLMRSWLK